MSGQIRPIWVFQKMNWNLASISIHSLFNYTIDQSNKQNKIKQNKTKQNKSKQNKKRENVT